MQKRIITIQDYSCLGRCSLTVALPILSAEGIETIGIPTALLSNHTAFPTFTFESLSCEMEKIGKQLSALNQRFDFMYTGYLGQGQGSIVLDIYEKLGKPSLFVDPAFADGGKLYKGFDESIVSQNRELVKCADIIKPNMTEALFLLGEPQLEKEVNPLSKYKEIAAKLSKLGPKKIVLTGAITHEDKIGILVYDDGNFSYFEDELLKGAYHGTGDAFASVLIGEICKGKSLLDSSIAAHDFVSAAIKETIKENVDGLTSGILFEKVLGTLTGR